MHIYGSLEGDIAIELTRLFNVGTLFTEKTYLCLFIGEIMQHLLNEMLLIIESKWTSIFKYVIKYAQSPLSV